jgi:hypothetical protein
MTRLPLARSLAHSLLQDLRATVALLHQRIEFMSADAASRCACVG